MGEVVQFTKRYVPPVARRLIEVKQKFRKGLIVGPDGNAHIGNGTISISGALRPSIDLRRAVLFWDHLVWPENIVLGAAQNADLDFLHSVGFLSKPVFSDLEGESSEIVKKSFLECFVTMESQNPGCWAIAQGSAGINIQTGLFEKTRGASVELCRAVPIPDANIPLEEVLEFNLDRSDEVIRFGKAIDDFYSSWVNSHDRAQQLKRSTDEIEDACNSLIRVAKEAKQPFRLSNWIVDYTMAPMSAYGVYELFEALPKVANIPFASEALAGSAGLICLKPAFGMKRKSVKSSPYCYAVSIDHKFSSFEL